jgi:PTH1 family peptidyl-tRNA hydrolase
MSLTLVGLGNPGAQYSCNRHNVGFMAIDEIVRSMNSSWKSVGRLHSDVALCKSVEHGVVYCVKPQNFMNRSGLGLQSVLSYYKESIKDCIVFHDEIDLDVGKIKYRFSGSARGHNGLRSINDALGSEYHKIGIGVSRPTGVISVSDHVLSNFTQSEKDIVSSVLSCIVNNLDVILSQHFHIFSNNFSKNVCVK